MADFGYVWLYDCRSESIFAGLGCGLDCMPALSAMTVPLNEHVWQL